MSSYQLDTKVKEKYLHKSWKIVKRIISPAVNIEYFIIIRYCTISLKKMTKLYRLSLFTHFIRSGRLWMIDAQILTCKNLLMNKSVFVIKGSIWLRRRIRRRITDEIFFRRLLVKLKFAITTIGWAFIHVDSVQMKGRKEKRRLRCL